MLTNLPVETFSTIYFFLFLPILLSVKFPLKIPFGYVVKLSLMSGNVCKKRSFDFVIILGMLRLPHQYLCGYLQVCGLKRYSLNEDHFIVSRCCARGESEESISYNQKMMQVSDPLVSKPGTDVIRN